MILEDDLKALLVAGIPNADVAVFDTNGLKDHYRIWISSAEFAGLNSFKRHQLINKILRPVYDDGRLHAAEITTDVPE